MSIIGISGRVASGKDTVATIIQQLTSTGYTKYDEFGDPIRSRDGYGHEVEWRSLWKVKKFAYKLKQFASMLTGIPVEKFEDQEFKKTFLGDEWSYLPKDEIFTDGIGLAFKKMTVREFLQKLGTECVRDNLHTNTWVNALFSDYKPETVQLHGRHEGHEIDIYPKWIITDVRFPNEFDAIKAHGGHVIRINRQLPNEPYKTLEQLHPSETALDTFDFDYVIDNNGTLQELEAKVKYFMIKFGYL